jgi:TetR/AcrR family transcriptional repressor of lmrAB and yxaGH operons
METATQSERINFACRDAYKLIETAFKEKLLSCGYSKEVADELGTVITAAIEGGIILSRTYHSGDPLRTVAKYLKELLSQSKE